MRNATRIAQVILALGLSIAGVRTAVAEPEGLDIVFDDGFEDYVPVPKLAYRFEGNGSNSGSLPGFTLNVANSTYGTGKVGQGVTFGAGGFAQVAGMRGVLGTYAQLTIAFWFFVPAPLSGQAFWDCSNRSNFPFGGVQLGQNGSTISVCVSTTTSAFLGGSCGNFTAPGAGAWHHWIIRYSGTGTGAGMGGPTEIYVDDVLAFTMPNDAQNNPVFNGTGMNDNMTIGGTNATMDELQVHNRTFTRAEQCTLVIGGTWTGSSCTLP